MDLFRINWDIKLALDKLAKLAKQYKELQVILKDSNYTLVDFAADKIRGKIKNPALKAFFYTLFPIIDR